MRVEGKLGMVRFEYIISGCIKISRAPAVRFKRKDDYTNDPARLQGPFDVGIVTDSLWRDRKVKVIDDAVAKANGEIKLELRWPKGDMVYYASLDAQNLWLKRVEKYDGQGNLKMKTVYSNARNVSGALWIPTTVEVFSPQGAKVGRTEMSDIKYNMGVQDSLFQ
jgi:outer membrane lipoprotein-sorting protein